MTDLIKIGRQTTDHGHACLSLKRLLGTRLLVQAQSGAGKSWFLRKLLEETHGQMQHLVIDPEGEFATLRQHFDYVIAAKHGGDTLASPRTAALLAERLLELGANAILDLYELKRDQRTEFVKSFLETLNDAPKKLWHPAIVVLDEAHVFCPQQGEAESASAVIDLATRGRKRGFCLVAATQRLSKMDKDAVAELGNKLIGRTTLDVDLKRAADEIGMGRDRWHEIQSLAAGEFFSYGPAFDHIGVKVIAVGGVKTTHPASGSSKASSTPPPTDKIRELLPKISDLPAEVEKKAQTEADLRKEIGELRAQVAQKPFAAIEDPRVPQMLALLKQCRDVFRLRAESVVINSHLTALQDGFEQLRQAVTAVEQREDAGTVCLTGIESVLNGAPVSKTVNIRQTGVVKLPDGSEHDLGAALGDAKLDGLTKSQSRILQTIANLKQRGLTPNREMVARWMAIHPNGGRYGSDLAALRAAELLDGFELKRPVKPTEAPTRSHALNALRDGSQQRIFEVLARALTTDRFTRDSLAAAMGIHPNGGRYGSDLSWLRTMGLIPERGDIYLTEAAGYPGT